MTDLSTIRAEIQNWERSFKQTRNKPPTVDDIKKDSAIGKFSSQPTSFIFYTISFADKYIGDIDNKLDDMRLRKLSSMTPMTNRHCYSHDHDQEWLINP